MRQRSWAKRGALRAMYLRTKSQSSIIHLNQLSELSRTLLTSTITNSHANVGYAMVEAPAPKAHQNKTPFQILETLILYNQRFSACLHWSRFDQFTFYKNPSILSFFDDFIGKHSQTYCGESGLPSYRNHVEMIRPPSIRNGKELMTHKLKYPFEVFAFAVNYVSENATASQKEDGGNCVTHTRNPQGRKNSRTFSWPIDWSTIEFVETFQFIAEDSFLYSTYKPNYYLNMKPAVLVQVFQVIVYGSRIRQHQRLRDVEVNEPKRFLQSVNFIPRAGPPMKALKLWNPDGLDHFCLTKSTFSGRGGGAIRVRHPQGQGWKMSSWIQEDPPVNANDSCGDKTFVATATEDNASTRSHVYFTEDCIFMIEYCRDGTMEGRIYTY
ncbi:hypothetical protein GG344DRAFT_62423 [Lentinula edodes]|nr:hypothetical protein GG344DRAFT_62423 [Lentinula edodes]